MSTQRIPDPQQESVGPITASLGGLRIETVRATSVTPASFSNVLERELFGEDPPSATAEPPAQPTIDQPSRTPLAEASNPEDVLWEFYRTRNTKPSYEERIELAKATGWLSENIAQWFTTKRYEDPGSRPASPSKTQSLEKAARKPRTTLTGAQIKVLEVSFERDAFPDAEERARLATELAVPSEAVYNWFRHRRAKDKRASARLRS